MHNDARTEFDRKIECLLREIPLSSGTALRETLINGITDSAVFVHETLQLCATSAKVLFGEHVKPEVVLAIYDLLINRMGEIVGWRKNNELL